MVSLAARDVGGNTHTGKGKGGLNGGLVNEWGLDGGEGGGLFFCPHVGLVVLANWT